MTSFDKWYQKPETKAQLASAKKKAWDQFTKQFPNADKNQFFVQESVDEKYRIRAEVFFKESARGVFIERVWFRQKVLEPKKEDCSWSDRRRRLSFSAITIKNNKSIANPGSKIHRIRAKRC